ncbi:MAG: serine hydrolase, partial [Bradymonadaceae bacterium]
TMEIRFNYQQMGAEQVVASAADLPFESSVGGTYHESDHLSASGGYAAAAAWGVEWGNLGPGYRETMSNQIFEPIGMESTTAAFEASDDTGNRARPHALDLQARYRPVDPALEKFAEPIAPAGGVWTNARDLSRFLITQLQRVVFRSAQTTGFSSHLAFVPGDDLGIAVLANAAGVESFAETVRKRMIEIAYSDSETTRWREVLLVYETPDRYAKIRRATKPSVTAERVAPWVGRYEHRLLGVVDLRARNGRAWLDVGEFDTELKSVRESGETPLLLGPTGVGKTCVARYTLDQLRER